MMEGRWKVYHVPGSAGALGNGGSLTADTSDLEKEIDQLVYKLYGLTEGEIKIVEGKKGPTENRGAEQERRRYEN